MFLKDNSILSSPGWVSGCEEDVNGSKSYLLFSFQFLMVFAKKHLLGSSCLLAQESCMVFVINTRSWAEGSYGSCQRQSHSSQHISCLWIKTWFSSFRLSSKRRLRCVSHCLSLQASVSDIAADGRIKWWLRLPAMVSLGFDKFDPF